MAELTKDLITGKEKRREEDKGKFPELGVGNVFSRKIAFPPFYHFNKDHGVGGSYYISVMCLGHVWFSTLPRPPFDIPK